MLFGDAVIFLRSIEAEFFPYDPEHPYKRITAKTSQKEGVRTAFEPIPDSGCLIDDIVFNKERLNISVRTKVKGTIEMKDGPLFGLPEKYPTYIYRAFTILKDGALHYSHMIVKVPPAKVEQLLSSGLVVGKRTDGLFLIDLTRCEFVPIGTRYTRDMFAKLCISELEIQAKLKVCKYFYDNVRQIVPEEPANLSEGIQRILTDHYIKPDGSFSPPMEISDDEPEIGEHTTLEVKIKSLNSLPSISALVKKLTAKKPLTLSEEFLYKPFKELTQSLPLDKEESAELLIKIMAEEKKKLLACRMMLVESKIPMYHSYPWFETHAISAKSDETSITEHFNWKDYEFTVVRTNHP